MPQSLLSILPLAELRLVSRVTLVRNTVAIPLFELDGRRGKFALVKEVARHLAEQRFKATMSIALNCTSDAGQS
jgi:hypothetical protein